MGWWSDGVGLFAASGRACVVGLLACGAACTSGTPAGPRADAFPGVAAEVGPSPLRRLSNREYLHALADLFPEQELVLPTLPSDGDVAGFDNAAEGQTASDVRIARYEAIANVFAEEITRDADALSRRMGCDIDVADSEARDACAGRFIAQFGRRVFRRPLRADEHDRFFVRFQRWAKAVDARGAVQLSVSAFLQAPQFLYRPEPLEPLPAAAQVVALGADAMASRLSFFLWQSVPDEALLDAASAGLLEREDDVRNEATRMLDDPRAARVYWDFHRQWLGLDRILESEQLVRTPAVYADWSASLTVAASVESQRFVENVLFDGGTMTDLLLSRRAWLNDELARLYGVPGPGAADVWTETVLPEDERVGILSRVAFLAGYAHRGATSPPIRANALLLRMLCRLPLPPPPGIDTTPPVADDTRGPQTNRMLFEERTRPPICQGCHVSLNGIGFGFENFTAAGGYTRVDHTLPVDARGRLYGTDVDREFEGVPALSAALSESADFHRCAVQQWLRFALGRAAVEGESRLIDALTARFLAGESVRDLLLAVVTSASFRFQRVEGS